MLRSKQHKASSQIPKKSRRTDLHMRSMLLNSQLDERFILDVLSSFQFYALNKEPREFLALLSSVTKLVRLSTDNIKEEAVPLSKEIKFIEKYIEIKLMSHSKPYTFDWKIPKKLDSSQVLVPAMYVQPYVAEVIDWILSVNCKSPVFFMNYKVNISNQVTMTFSATTRDKENMSKLQRRKQQAIRIKDFKCKESRRGFLNAIKGKNAYEIKRYSLFDSSEIQRGCEVELTFPEN